MEGSLWRRLIITRFGLDLFGWHSVYVKRSSWGWLVEMYGRREGSVNRYTCFALEMVRKVGSRTDTWYRDSSLKSSLRALFSAANKKPFLWKDLAMCVTLVLGMYS